MRVSRARSRARVSASAMSGLVSTILSATVACLTDSGWRSSCRSPFTPSTVVITEPSR